MKKVAVILGGCGYLDGSEIRESVAVLWALDHAKIESACFAIDQDQADVVNTLSAEPMPDQNRNQLIEAARIARGKIAKIESLNVDEFDGLIFPGGFGVAKNFCTFATQGSAAKVEPRIQDMIEKFHTARKPIGAVCIAPALIALALKGKGIELTVGKSGEPAQEIEKLGQKHIVCATNGCHVDSSHRIVSTPAYMDDHAKIADVFLGIQKMVNEMTQLA